MNFLPPPKNTCSVNCHSFGVAQKALPVVEARLPGLGAVNSLDHFKMIQNKLNFQIVPEPFCVSMWYMRMW